MVRSAHCIEGRHVNDPKGALPSRLPAHSQEMVELVLPGGIDRGYITEYVRTMEKKMQTTIV